jgi:FdhD protein
MGKQPEIIPDWISSAEVSSKREGRLLQRRDYLAEEIAVSLVFNGISHTVMMMSPADLEDFALGFGLTEGIFENASELYGVEQNPADNGIELLLEVSPACEWRLKERKRSLAGRTGCGLCGTESLNAVHRTLTPVASVSTPHQAIAYAQDELRGWQVVQQLTGATHAAAWASIDGHILHAREDIGRHNALDKLVGSMAKNKIDPLGGFILITSRASFEMVQKTIAARVGVLAAVSAPTALAVKIAQAGNLALAGFVRAEDMTAYTFPERFGLSK